MLGTYDPDEPGHRPDQATTCATAVERGQEAAVQRASIVYMMDVSGSMGDEQKELVRLEAFWIDTWLRRNYEGIESRYIVHDVRGEEVDKQDVLPPPRGRRHADQRPPSSAARSSSTRTTTPTSGTSTSSTSPTATTRSEADNRDCVKMLDEQLLPICNMFGYCQVASAYGSGSFINVLHEAFPRGLADEDGPKLITSQGQRARRHLRVAPDVLQGRALIMNLRVARDTGDRTT